MKPEALAVRNQLATESSKLLWSLLTEDEAAALLALSPSTLKKWRRTGQGPRYHRLGSAVRYRWDDLEEFLEGARENPRSARHDEKSDR